MENKNGYENGLPPNAWAAVLFAGAFIGAVVLLFFRAVLA